MKYLNIILIILLTALIFVSLDVYVPYKSIGARELRTSTKLCNDYEPHTDQNVDTYLSRTAKEKEDITKENLQTIKRRKLYQNSNENGYKIDSFNDRKCLNDSKICQKISFSEQPLDITALASFPGSGNTWARHLIQQLTGIYTSSVYCEKLPEFPAGCVHENLHKNTIVTKTHRYGSATLKIYKRAIILVRSPVKAIEAELNRRTQGHTGITDLSKVNETEIDMLINAWRWFYQSWFSFDGPHMVVLYDKLVGDFPRQIRRFASFLNANPDRCIFDCVLRNQEGSHHRKKHRSSMKLPKYIIEKAKRSEEEIMIMLKQRHPKQQIVRLVL